MWVNYFIWTGVLMLVLHELGHFITAMLMKLNPKFQFTNFKPVVYYDKPTEDWQFRAISQAGFVVEMCFGVAIAAGVWWFNLDFRIMAAYMVLLTAHFMLYPWTARYSTSNDFDGLGSIEKEEK